MENIILIKQQQNNLLKHLLAKRTSMKTIVDVFSRPCPFTVFIVDITAMFIVPAFIYALQLMRRTLSLCYE